MLIEMPDGGVLDPTLIMSVTVHEERDSYANKDTKIPPMICINYGPKDQGRFMSGGPLVYTYTVKCETLEEAQQKQKLIIDKLGHLGLFGNPAATYLGRLSPQTYQDRPKHETQAEDVDLSERETFATEAPDI